MSWSEESGLEVEGCEDFESVGSSKRESSNFSELLDLEAFLLC